MSTAVEVVALHVSPVHAYEGRLGDGPRPDPGPVSRDHVVVRAGRAWSATASTRWTTACPTSTPPR
ncbi:hypothetical protein [Saccharothrix carnea]|uniref:hypothetical protein n=1 Tax=Saccharothrix carnea TaxID=1280637 RepID=UPI001FE66569|nr:hypothetical protein [Saccharothrix carnea]